MKNPKFKIGDRFRISKYELPFMKGYKAQFTQEVFEIVALSSENLQHTQQRMIRTILSVVNAIEKS